MTEGISGAASLRHLQKTVNSPSHFLLDPSTCLYFVYLSINQSIYQVIQSTRFSLTPKQFPNISPDYFPLLHYNTECDSIPLRPDLKIQMMRYHPRFHGTRGTASILMSFSSSTFQITPGSMDPFTLTIIT